MRRKAPTAQLSPQAIKQIAVLAVVLTGLLAMFVNGERTQLEAAIQAREAKNRLIKLEAEKIGTRKLNAGLKVAQQPTGEGFERLNNSAPDVSNPTPPRQWGAPPVDRRPSFLRVDTGTPPPPRLTKGVRAPRTKRVKTGAEETALLKQSAALRSGAKSAEMPD